MTTAQISKGSRVTVTHEAGTEFGMVTSVIDGQVDVDLDDGTRCWFPARQCRPAVAAGEAQPGQLVRIEQGPKAGKTGTVESVTTAQQMGTLIRTAIIDFGDGSRSVRPANENVTVLA